MTNLKTPCTLMSRNARTQRGPRTAGVWGPVMEGSTGRYAGAEAHGTHSQTCKQSGRHQTDLDTKYTRVQDGHSHRLPVRRTNTAFTPDVILRHLNQSSPVDGSLWLFWCGDNSFSQPSASLVFHLPDLSWRPSEAESQLPFLGL